MRQIPSSQLVANSTSDIWCQAYSTLNLYIVLHVEGDNVAAIGREALEQLQREYFALDTKDLPSIKGAVESVTLALLSSHDFSLVLLTISDEVAQIVTANNGRVSIIRNSRYGVVAEGEIGEVESFSGKLNSGDIVNLGTRDFFAKVSGNELTELKSDDVNEIAEQLAPTIHSSSTGGEAAIFVKIEGDNTTSSEVGPVLDDEYVPTNDKPTTRDVSHNIHKDRIKNLYQLFLSKVDTTRIQILKHKKKSLIVLGVVLLTILLATLLARDRMTSGDVTRSEIVASVTLQVEEIMSDVDAVVTVDSARAIELLKKAEGLVIESINSPDITSPEKDALNLLLVDIRAQLDDLEGGERVELVRFFSDSDYSDPFVAGFGQEVYAVSGDSVATITDGDISDETTLSGEAVKSIAGEGFVYVLTEEAVERIDHSNFESETFEDTTGVDLSTFGGSVYVLTGDDILRSSGEGTSSYFPSTSPLSAANSLAIDGAIYVQERGEIFKFLRGISTDFSLTGLVTPLSSSSMLYTNEEMDALYALDPENARVVVLSKEGEFETQYRAEELASATSFVVLGSTVYISTPEGVFSFEL